MSQPSLTQLTLIYYGYHIRNTIDEGTQPIADAQRIWEDLSKINGLEELKKNLICYDENNEYKPSLEEQKQTEYLKLLKPELEIIKGNFNDTVEISLRPFLLHDTYAFELNLKASRFEDFEQLQKPLFTFLKPSLGFTWYLYGKMSSPIADYSSLAQDWIETIFKNSPQIIKEDLLNSCPFLSFDVGHQSPIFVCFNLNSIKFSSEIDKNLLDLFWYYHKIVYAYQDSRELDKEARKIYAQIEGYVNSFAQDIESKQRLEIFKKRLSKIPKISIDYAKTLRNIKDHQNTIISNLENLKNTVKDLQSLPNTKLEYFTNFIKQTEIYIKQIDTDLNFLSPGETLLQRLTDNIRGITAIDQVEQNEKSQEIDQSLERLIAYFGIGLAVSSVSSTVITEGGQKLICELLNFNLCPVQPSPLLCEVLNLKLCAVQPSPLEYFYLGFLNIFFHLFLGLVAIPITLVVLKLFKALLKLIRDHLETKH